MLGRSNQHRYRNPMRLSIRPLPPRAFLCGADRATGQGSLPFSSTHARRRRLCSGDVHRRPRGRLVRLSSPRRRTRKATSWAMRSLSSIIPVTPATSAHGAATPSLSSNDAPTTEATAGALRIWPREIIFFIISVGCELLKRALLPWSGRWSRKLQRRKYVVLENQPAPDKARDFHLDSPGCTCASKLSAAVRFGSEKHLSSVNRKRLAQMPRFHSPSGVSVPAGWNGSAFPVESQDSMSAADVEIDKDAGAQQDGDGGRYEVCSEATSGWTRRVRIGKAPDEREMNPDRKTALELSVRAYAEKGDGHVVNPKIGTSFDSLDEAYEFYNIYSWETGFGFCTICRVQGHKCTTCPKRGDLPKAPRKLPKCTTKFPLD